MASSDAVFFYRAVTGASFSTFFSTLVVGQTLMTDPRSCKRYLELLHNRLSPYLGDISDGQESSDFEWTVLPSFDLMGHYIDLHEIRLTKSSFKIIVQSKANLGSITHVRYLMLARASRQIENAFIAWLEMFLDTTLRAVNIKPPTLVRFLNKFFYEYIKNSDIHPGGIALEFLLKKKNLKRVSITLENDDCQKFIDLATSTDRQFSEIFFDHILKATGVKFRNLQLTKVACKIGILSHEGRVKFYLGKQPSQWQINFIRFWIAELAFQIWKNEE
ncbi:hypothetical protein V1514DRAFT_322938 [Lipomyces japonicus]|uniref:uncharacterized protein n=1 Tax=Lipomyces japonicus TaxID=56871 RepID=UPI0034CDB4F4